jgi:alkylation response protein AidB-like acyl-CoA dehydrogenase
VDFDLTPEQVAFRDAVVDFARTQLDPHVRERDEAEVFPRDLWTRCGEFGLPGLPVAPEYGGQGADPVTTVVALEALGYGCRDNGLIFSLGAHLWSAVTPIERFGTDEQKQRYLPGLCDGRLIGVQAMTEPDSGSDAFALTTSVRADGDSVVLNGTKTFITNAPVADVFVVFVTSDASKGWSALSAYVVERDTPGLSVSMPFEKMGLRTSPMAEVHFDECRIPAANLLAREGAGMAVFNHSMDWERCCILAGAVGTMQRQVETSVAYATERQQGGQAIGKYQAVAHRIVDMKVRLEAARLLLYRTAWLKGQGRRSEMESSIVKLFLSESWVQSSLDQLQIHGGLGYLRDAELERDVRDALAGRIYSGTSDIQRNMVARRLGL